MLLQLCTIVQGPLHALAIRGRTSGNFHSCRQCRRGNFVHIAYGNWTIFFFFTFLASDWFFLWHLIVWITFDHHYFWISQSMEFSNNSTICWEIVIFRKFPIHLCTKCMLCLRCARCARLLKRAVNGNPTSCNCDDMHAPVTARKFHSRYALCYCSTRIVLSCLACYNQGG